MAWEFNDWITKTTAEIRWLTFLQHMEEVGNAIDSRTQSDGTTIDPSVVLEYYNTLSDKKSSLDPGGTTGHGGGSRLTRGRILKL